MLNKIKPMILVLGLLILLAGCGAGSDLSSSTDESSNVSASAASPNGPAAAVLAALPTAEQIAALIPPEPEALIEYTEADLDLLAAIIHIEAGSEAWEGKVAVGGVIINRILDPNFPNTLYDVLYARGQFPDARSGRLARLAAEKVDEDCYEAARAVLYGENPVPDARYFNAGHGQGVQIGNQHFY